MTHDSPNKPTLDAHWHAALAQFTGGLSPSALATAYLDWSLHLFGSPEKQANLVRQALTAPLHTADVEDDPRYADPAWSAWPYNVFAQSHLAVQSWWDAATRDIPGVADKHSDIVNFTARQWIDMASPANFALTNPKVMQRTRAEGGQNLLRGARYWLDDFNRLISQKPRQSSALKVGETLATTPGDVVLRNDLMELIRYRPNGKTVHPEPILIVPAWIMKYYILDLTDERSLVAYLRDQGFEVYVISWKNPGAEDSDMSMQDYADLGVRASLAKIRENGATSVHGVGYCLGGTLLSIVTAAMARDNDDTFKTISLLASQVDFSDPGELGLFINESQVAFLEDIMETRGYLKADQMAGAFRMLRSNDLIWSRVIRHYLLGERTPDNPLLAWNADATRMPAKMHSQYLRELFLKNNLAKGRYKLDGSSVALTDVRHPIYCVATETDHVSPWPSVYKLLLLTDTDVTFVLTNGGHNGGILSEPGHKGRHFRTLHKTEGDKYTAHLKWYDATPPVDGSWWAHWSDWLKSRSSKATAPRPLQIKSIAPAPGSYVLG